MVLAVGSILYYGFAEPHWMGSCTPPAAEGELCPTRKGFQPLDSLVGADPKGLGLMFGVALFMFSAHMESVSIEQDMFDRSQFHRMLWATFAVIVLMYLSFGVLVYMFFGEVNSHDFALLCYTCTAILASKCCWFCC